MTVEEKNKDFPFVFKDLDPEVNADLRSKFTGDHSGFVRVGPKGYTVTKRYEKEAALYYNMPVRPSDVFVVTLPRSGTTWTQELIWLIENDFDYEKAAAIHMNERFPFLDFSVIINPNRMQEAIEKNKGKEVAEILTGMLSPTTERLREAPSPRFIKSHLPLSLLPPALPRTARVVYVARDPRDVAVSCYHHNRFFTMHGYVGDFKTYWNYFINDLILWTPYFEHILEGWEARNHPNVLFLFYEELSKDLPATIKKVAKFLDKQLTEEQVAKLTDHLSIENFKKNKSVTEDFLHDLGFVLPNEQPFIRKGKAGGWREYFDEEMTEQARRWIADNLGGTDLRFPVVDKNNKSNDCLCNML